MKKTIALICEYTIFPERIGGMDYFFVAYDAALKEKGYQPNWFFKDVTTFDFYKELIINSANNRDLESYFLNECLVKNLKFDIVITHFLQPVSPFFKVIKNQMNPYIINVDHNPRPLEGFPIKKRLKNKVKGLLYGKYVDKLIGVSAYTKKHILNDFGAYLNHKTAVIYNGIDTSVYIKRTNNTSYNSNSLSFGEGWGEENKIKFIVVSHLRESKGIQDLLKALYLLEGTILNSIMVDIFGDGPYKNELMQLQKDYGLENIVNFKGNSPKLNELFYQYHYLLQPTYMECFSLSILESLACNVPVITTTVGGNPEIIIDGVNGYLFKPKDIKALAQIIQKIVTNEMAISNEVYSNIEKNFTLKLMVQNHLKLVTCI